MLSSNEALKELKRQINILNSGGSRGGRSRHPPPLVKGPKKQKNDHILAEIYSRMRHLRPQVSIFFGGHAPGPNQSI